MTAQEPEPGARLSRDGYLLEVDDAFRGPDLDRDLWIPHYLPQWSSRAASAARYALDDGGLRLRIDADQPPWCPEFDDGVRVSSLQTGLHSGPLGSRIGQHRFRSDVVVREPQPTLALYTPRYGLFELQARACADPSAMVALWMIGFEDVPERSAEICICEIFGRDVEPAQARVGVGVHPFADPAIRDDFEAVRVAIDARRSHWYAAEWTPDGVAFYVDERLVKHVAQSPDYPMQLMLNIYDFPDESGEYGPPDHYPKEFVVERFRGWRPADTEARWAPKGTRIDRVRSAS